jgi:hypothetical protein
MSSEMDFDGKTVQETKETIIRRVQAKDLQQTGVPTKRGPWIPPQSAVDKAWARFSVKIFSNVTAIVPGLNPFHQQASPPPEQGQLVTTNFEEAAKACKRMVEKIVEEHKRVNQRYRDPHFDIDLDLKSQRGYYIGTLAKPTQLSHKDDSKSHGPDESLPGSVKRADVSGGLYDN